MDHDVRKAMRVIAQAGPIAVNEMLEMFPVLRHETSLRKGFDFDIEDFKTRSAIERADEWDRWRREIPGITFPAKWKIHMSPPMTRAIVRFRINDCVSVYLDCYDRLGCYGGPYWEVYPVDEDVGRCGMNDTDELIALITRSLASED